MSKHPTLFDERQVRTGDGHKFVQEGPAGDLAELGQKVDQLEEELEQYERQQGKQPEADGTGAKLDALVATVHTLKGKCFTYLHLLRTMLGGKRLKPKAQAALGQEYIYDLTDMEAARWLGWERTSINGRRNQLSGGSMALPGTKAYPLVVKSTREYVDEEGRRRCLITGNRATAWQASLDLFHGGVQCETRCESCGMPIRWVRTPSGKRMPVDVPLHAPNKSQTLVTRAGVVHTAGAAEGYISHFATCPNANDHRRQ